MICRRLERVGSGPTAYYDITGGRGRSNYASGDEATLQAARCELKLLLGEWFLDVTRGIPWLKKPGNTTQKPILGQLPADLPYAETLVKAAILGVPGVKSILEFSLNFNHETRVAVCSGRVLLQSGAAYAISETVL